MAIDANLIKGLMQHANQGGIALADILGLSKEELNAMFAFALESLDTSNINNAAAICAGLLVLDPLRADVWRAYGVALQRMSYYKRAIQAYSAAIALQDDIPYVYLYRAEIALLLENKALAKRDLETFVALSQHQSISNQFMARFDYLVQVLEQVTLNQIQRVTVTTQVQAPEKVKQPTQVTATMQYSHTETFIDYYQEEQTAIVNKRKKLSSQQSSVMDSSSDKTNSTQTAIVRERK